MAAGMKSFAAVAFLVALVSFSLAAEARPLSNILKLHSLAAATGAGNGWGFDWFTIGAAKDGPSPGVGHAFTDGGIKSSGPSPGIGHAFTDGGIKSSGPSPGIGNKYVTGTRQ